MDEPDDRSRDGSRDSPGLDAARHAALRGLDVDETAEVLYRDWMTIEWAAENTAGVRKAVARVQQVARSYDISLHAIIEQIIDLETLFSAARRPPSFIAENDLMPVVGYTSKASRG